MANPNIHKAIHVIVYGLVQGVFYRAFTQEKALSLGLVGWVCNVSDGSVELMVAGNKASIDILISFLKQGPQASRVDRLDIKEIDDADKVAELIKLKDFIVKR